MDGSDENLKEPEHADKRFVRFYCPYCRHGLQSVRDLVGEVADCDNCGKQCRVPRPKLSIKGELPTGAKLDTDADGEERPRLRLSQTGARSAPLPVSDQAPVTSSSADTGSRLPWGRWLGNIGLAAIVVAVGWFAFSRLDFEADVQVPEDVRPSADVVFQALDVLYRRAQKAEMAKEIMDADIRNLALLRGLEADTMTEEERIFEQGIEQRRESIRMDTDAMAQTVFELYEYYQRWSGYTTDLVEQKIEEANTSSNPDKAQLLSLVLVLLESAPTDPGAALGGLKRELESTYLGDSS